MEKERATELFESGYNCAQAVFVPTAEKMGIDFDTAMQIASSLGGGLACGDETCGAVLGMCMAYGLKAGVSTCDAGIKAAHGAKTRALIAAFREKHKDLSCKALKVPEDRAVCVALVQEAVELVAKA